MVHYRILSQVFDYVEVNFRVIMIDLNHSTCLSLGVSFLFGHERVQFKFDWNSVFRKEFDSLASDVLVLNVVFTCALKAKPLLIF